DNLRNVLAPVLVSELYSGDGFAFEKVHFTDGELRSVQTLFDVVATLEKALPWLAPERTPDEVRVLLPATVDPHQIIIYQRQVGVAWEPLLSSQIDFKITVRGWENGSLWINFALGSAAFVVIVGAAMWSAAVVRKKWIEGDLLVKQAEALDIKNELLEQL